MMNLSNYSPEKVQLPFERRVLDLRIEPCWRLHNGLAMTECFKRVLPMVAAQPTRSPSPKWKMMIREMPTSIVYTTPAELHRFNPFLFFSTIRSKKIKRKRIGIKVNDLLRFFCRPEPDYCQNRAANFFLHSRRVYRRIHHNRRFDVHTFTLHSASGNILQPPYQNHQPVTLFLIDDLSIIIAFLRLVGVKFLYCIFQCIYQLFF